MTNRKSAAVPSVDNSKHKLERALICTCARLRLNDSEREELGALLQADLDWPCVIALAQRHALVPLLYRQIQKCDAALVPPEYFQKLRTGYQENLARNLVLVDELLSIARGLRALGIDCLPFKGPLLGQLAYEDPATRQSTDLDILVLPANINAARECLIANGYRPAKELTPRQEELLIRNQHNMQFVRDDGPLLVELHWRVAPELFALGMSAEALWGHLETVNVGEVELKALPTEELLLALCIHGARHLWERISWICDIAGVLNRNPDVDWAHLLKRAEETDTERMLLLGLCLARDFAGAQLRHEVARRIASDAVLNSLAKIIADRLFAAEVSVPYVQTMRDQIRLRRQWRSRARYLSFAVTPNEEDLDLKSVPTFLSFVYYGLRPLRLLRKRSESANKINRVTNLLA